jgi:hypothetical protein
MVSLTESDFWMPNQLTSIKGLATIVNMTAFVCVPAFGPWALTLTWTLWWVDVVISVACCMFLPFAMYVFPVVYLFARSDSIGVYPSTS